MLNGRYLHAVDPFDRPVTIHPGTSAREIVEDEAVFDFNMLQTGHGDRNSLPNTVERVSAGYEAVPPMLPGCYPQALWQVRRGHRCRADGE